ncbi:hypothetical protein GGR57DRAFT_395558 [Xylariaceae sp. FL1272]|nr:hypothetical protein GGR57DRAFT_395558 [Xylariaceae sp. FL1272]
MACRNYDTIGMLIDEHYTYAFTAAELLQVCVDSVYGWQGMVVYKMVARAISGRRTALLHLAISNLSKPQLEDLGYREGELPDTCAFEMYETLLRHNVRIPYALAVETPGSLHHFAAIEGSWVIGLLAALYDHGFREIDVMHKNETPLQKFDRYNHEAQRWFLSKGAKPRIPGFFDGVTDVQFGMAYYFALFHLDTSGYKSGFVLPPVDQCLLLRQWTEWYKSDLARSRRDQCRCFCSSRGCSPVHFFVCRQSAFGESTPTDLVLRLWCKNTNCSIANVEDLYDERCRLEIFERLEMKHTCHSHARLRHGQFRYGRLSAAEIKEIRREDEWANCQLELLMKIYMISRNKFLPHHPNLGDFAKHLWHWWHELDVILPELRDYPWRNWQTREKHVLHALKDAGYIQEAEPATSGEHAIPDFLDVIKLHFAHYLDKRNVQSARPRRRTKRLPWRVRRRYLGTPRWLK